MSFSTELLIWFVFTTVGLVTATGSLRYARLILHANEQYGSPDDVIDGSKHLSATEAERVIGWSMFVTTGLVALFSPPPSPPVVQTLTNSLITWLLIGTIGLWSYKTASDFLYARRRVRAVRLRAATRPTQHGGKVTMNDATRRAIRSFIQVGVVQAVMQLWNAFAPTPLNTEQMAAITVVATPLVVLVQNLLEDNTAMPALLKHP